MWILLIFSHIYGGRVATSVNFQTLEACESAMKVLQKESEGLGSNIDARVYCFKDRGTGK